MPLHQDLTVSPPVATFCTYKLQAIKYCVRWAIRDYIGLTIDDKKALSSPVFFVGNNDEFEVQIAYYPKGDPNNKNRTADTRASIYLVLNATKNFLSPITGKVRFGFINVNNACMGAEEMEIDDNTFTPDLGWGFKEWSFSHKQVVSSSYLFGGSFVISCEVSLNLETIMSGIHQNRPKLRISERNLLQDFSSLLRSGDYSDVTLTASDRVFKAHKAILSARSPVFKAMFRQEMEEMRTNVVNITDVEADVLRDVLLFIYTGKMASFDGIEEELLIAAEKYQLEDLKTMCQEDLAKTLTVENVSHMLVLADIYQAKFLKDSAVHFINLHKCRVSETEGWNLAKKEHPHVLVLAFL